MRSRLQHAFMLDMAASFKATKRRILRELTASPEHAENILEKELRGLYHGIFVILDGGTALADEGLVQIADEDGIPFDRFLHEICFEAWDEVDDRPKTAGV